MDFEDILLEVGDYGKFQKDLFFYFLLPAGTLLPWFTMNVFFMVSVPDHWCNVPEVAASNLSITDQKSLIGPPGEHCYMYNISFTDYLNGDNYKIPINSSTMPCNQGYQYDHTYWDSTVATTWNMVCEDGHYTSLVLTLCNVGSILGTPIYGMLSDKIGRKITFFIIVLINVVTSIGSVLMTNFIAFLVFKTINGSLMPCIFQLPFIIVLEVVAPEMRTRMNGIANCAWTVGASILPLIAYLSRGWVTLGLVTSSVTIVFIFYWKLLPESPRWLVSQERYEEATKIMHNIAVKNGKTVDESSILQKIEKLGEKVKKEKEVDGVENSSADLLRYPQLRKKFIIITVCWMADIMAYYGLTLNVSNLAGNEFVNFFLISLVEIPGYLTSWAIMERYGRRWCTAAGFVAIGLTCMFPSIDLPYMDVICSMIGKYFSALTFMATYQQSSELYPTVVRSLGMGMSSTVSTLATLIVPYMIYLSIYGKAIPFVIIGLCCIAAGILASFLPETLNENLPQTIFEAEDFGRNQKFFSFNRRRRSVSKERAASIGLKPHGFEGFSEKHPNRNSQNYQNVEINSVIENPLNSSVKVFSTENRTENHLTYRHSIPSENQVAEINNKTHEFSGGTGKNSAVNMLPASHDVKVKDVGVTQEGGFSYVNEVFEVNDKASKQNEKGSYAFENTSNNIENSAEDTDSKDMHEIFERKTDC